MSLEEIVGALDALATEAEGIMTLKGIDQNKIDEFDAHMKVFEGNIEHEDPETILGAVTPATPATK